MNPSKLARYILMSVVLAGSVGVIFVFAQHSRGIDPYQPVSVNDDWTPVEQDFDGTTMVLVPVGCFMMGSDELPLPYNKPVHGQCIDEPFWIDKTEVTNAQYGSVASGLDDSFFDCAENSSAPDQPRNCLTFVEAQNYCASRNMRLPTELEWEYAARGVDSLEYPWGDELDFSKTVYREDGALAEPVGSIPEGASWVGALDMSGNLCEWTSSMFVEYPYDTAQENMSDLEEWRILRGCGFYFAFGIVSPAMRNPEQPDNVYSRNGVRCIRDYADSGTEAILLTPSPKADNVGTATAVKQMIETATAAVSMPTQTPAP